MHFSINVNCNDSEYLEFNRFVQFHTPSGRKANTPARIILALLPLLIGLYNCVESGFSAAGIISAVLMIPLSVLVVFTFEHYMWFFSKLHIKSLMKKNRLYSPASHMEFYEDYFVDYSSDKQVKTAYSTVQSVYIVNSQVVYIFENAIQAFIVPVASFSSLAEWNGFISFLNAKTGNVNIVNTKK